MTTGTHDARPRCRPWSARATTALLATLAMALVAGCAGTPPKGASAESPAYEPGEMERRADSPFADFNIGEDQIPEVLLRALADPYARPAPLDCATIAAEVAELDAALGSDFDVVKGADRPDDFAYDAMIGAVRGLVPYRGVIGLLTGTRERQRRSTAAVASGATRRGYLKGLGESIGCDFPAAPKRAAPGSP